MIGKRRKWQRAVIGYVGFFLLIAAVVTAAVLVYAAASESTDNRTVIAWSMAGCIAAVAILCTAIDFVRRRLTVDRPVDKILSATEAIARGEFSTRLTPTHAYSRYDDFDMIMVNLNVMAEELQKTEMVSNDFIANVSHEIKTPISIIQNYAFALCDDRLPSESRREYAETLSRAAKRLTSLVSDVLKLNKLENNNLVIVKKPVDVGESVRECILAFEEALDEKNIALECEIEDGEVNSDADCLAIVWNNLISNAVKFTPKGGSIRVTVADGGRTVTVADSGCGISSEVGAHIFDKFYQGDKSHSGNGNGLGLALVKKVIDVLGGEIGVKSEVGTGSEFTVKLRGDV